MLRSFFPLTNFRFYDIMYIVMKQRKLKNTETKDLHILLPKDLYEKLNSNAQSLEVSKGLLVQNILSDYLTSKKKVVS